MRVVPSELVVMIDKHLPWAKSWSLALKALEGDAREQFGHVAVSWLCGFVELLKQIPDTLLILDTQESSEFLISRDALRRAAELAVPGEGPVRWPMLGERDCVEIIRTALAKCPDEAPSTSGGGLTFIKDADWRTSLLTDMAEVERALANSEWKSATVIGGSILESLLLWAVNERSADVLAAISSAISKGSLTAKPPAAPEDWYLYQLIEISLELKEITPDTANTVRPGKSFRNLIHPGRTQRLGVRCDRGTAYTTYGAIFNVVRDLTAKHR
jgi:hypothetical protein